MLSLSERSRAGSGRGRWEFQNRAKLQEALGIPGFVTS